MARAEASIVIKRPVKEVSDYLEDMANDPEWQSYVLEAEQTSEGPVGLGTTARGVSSFLGRQLEWTSVVIEYEPDVGRSTAHVKWGPIEFDQTVTLEPVEGGTRVSFLMEGEPRGFFRLADPIVVRMIQRDIEGNLARLKDILEAEG